MKPKEIRRRYGDLLKTFEWRDFSARVIAYYDSKCWCCDSIENLQVHHLEYRDVLPWEYGFHEVRVLCDECHKAIHIVADDIWVECLRFQPHELELLLKRMKTDETFPSNRDKTETVE